jgi:AraC-like DNA-binding protein
MNKRLVMIKDWETLAQEAGFVPAVMADLCLVSLRQLERFFKQKFNSTPRKWTRELRCRIAVTLISQGWSTKAVAGELKYANESHFCHEFKKSRGVPSQSFAPAYRAKSNVAFRPECRP